MGRLYCVRFYASVAMAVARRISRLNGGKWPRTLSQWQVVAGRLKFVLLLVDEPRVQDCCLFGERVILLRFTTDEPALLRSACHEIAHAVLAQSGPSGNLLDWPIDPDECHYTARLVEHWVDVTIAEDGQLTLFEDEISRIA